MGRYASETAVPEERSRGEIERTLRRYGATGFLYAWQGRTVVILFEMRGRRIRFMLPLPEPSDFEWTPSGRARTSRAVVREAYEQAVRQCWRALALIIKAKLESIESGVTTFEDEFLARMVLPGGGTVGELLAPQLDAVLESGALPPLLPAPGGLEG